MTDIGLFISGIILYMRNVFISPGLYHESCLQVAFLGVNLFSDAGDKAFVIILTEIRYQCGRREPNVNISMDTESVALGHRGCLRNQERPRNTDLKSNIYKLLIELSWFEEIWC